MILVITIIICLISIAAAWKYLVIDIDWILCRSFIFAAVIKSVATLHFCCCFFQHQGLSFCYTAVAAAESHNRAVQEESVQWKKCNWTQISHLAAAEVTHLCCAAALCAALCRTSSGRHLPAPTQILLEDQTRPRSLEVRMEVKIIEKYIMECIQN